MHSQIIVGEDEAPENALKRFRWATKSSGLVNEVCADHLGGYIWSSIVNVVLRAHPSLLFPQRKTQLGGDVQARRRRYFENKQDEIKRRVRDGHMKKSK